MTARPSGAILFATFTEAERHRQHAENHRESGHEHGPQARHASGERRVPSVGPEVPSPVGERDDQNAAVYGRDART